MSRCNFCGKFEKVQVPFFWCMKLEEPIAGSIPKQWERVLHWQERALRLEKQNPDQYSGVGKGAELV